MTSQSTISASVHVLGSVSGYCTLACSDDIAPVEREALEILGFGQTDDVEYLKSLATVPAGFGRVLPSGRYALTRCFAGEPDSAGRQTLLFATLVFNAADWRDQVCHSAWEIFSEPSAWAFRDRGTTGRVHVPAAPRSNLGDLRDPIIRAVAALMDAQAKGAIAVCEDTLTMRAAVAQIASVLPSRDRARVRWGAGVLSVGAAVDVCTLPAIAETSGRRRVISFDATHQSTSAYAAALAQFWKTGTEPPRTFIDGLCAVGDAGTSVGTIPEPRSDSESRFVPYRAISPLKIVGLIAMCLALLAVAWFVVGRQPSALPTTIAVEPPPSPVAATELAVVATPASATPSPRASSAQRQGIWVRQEWKAGRGKLESLRALAAWIEKQLIVGYERNKANAVSSSSRRPSSLPENGPRAFEQVPRPSPNPAQEETLKPHAITAPATPLEKAHAEVVENNVDYGKKSVRAKVKLDTLREWRDAVAKPPPHSEVALQVVRAGIKEQKKLYDAEYRQRAAALRKDQSAVPAIDFNSRVHALSDELIQYRAAIGVDKESEWVASLQAEVDKLLK